MASNAPKVTVDSLVTMLLDDRKLARKNNQSAAAVAAVMAEPVIRRLPFGDC